MDLGAIFIGFAILIICIPYVIKPFLPDRKKQSLNAISFGEDKEESHNNDALISIRDLDFDFQIGKITEEDYEVLRAQLVIEAAEYLQAKKLEDEKIEEIIRARSQAAKSPRKCEKCGGIIRSQDRYCPICGAIAQDQVVSDKPAVQNVCRNCGQSIKDKDLFCTGCGMRVNEKFTAQNSVTEF